jgi:hypothetical protein
VPEGLVRSGDFREGTPITANHVFGTPTDTTATNDGNVNPQANATLDSNPVTWTIDPAHFGNQIGFSMQATPSIVNVAQNSTGTSTITITALLGTPSVTLTYSGAPTNVSIAFGTNPTTSTSVATVTVGATVPVGKYTITITGTASPEVENTNIHLVVT